MFTQISLCPDWCPEWYHIILFKWAKPSSTREKSQIQKSLNNQNCSKLRRRLRGLKRKGFFWATKVPASSISWGWVNTFTAPYLVWQPIKSGRASPKKSLLTLNPDQRSTPKSTWQMVWDRLITNCASHTVNYTPTEEILFQNMCQKHL